MSGNRMAVIGGIAFALLVAGCDSTDNSAGDPPVPTVDGVAASTTVATPPSTSPEPAQPSPSATTRRATSSAPAPAANPNECKVAELKLSLGGGDAAAGTHYRQLRFTNTGGRTCVIQGFPGVSYVAGDDGHQVGPAAYRDGRKGPAISLKPGMTVHAPLGFVQVANYDPAVCRPTEVRGLRVYPPHEYDSLFLPAPGTGCAGTPPGHQLVVRTVQ